jgi:hypothetical protein
LRPGRNKRRAALSVLCLITVLAIPAGATAAAGDGPYTPFPEDPTGRALDFVFKLNRDRGGGGRQGTRVSLTTERLIEGVSLVPQPKGAGSKKDAQQRDLPFEQAGVASSSDPPSPAMWPFVALAAALGVGALVAALMQRGVSLPRPHRDSARAELHSAR